MTHLKPSATLLLGLLLLLLPPLGLQAQSADKADSYYEQAHQLYQLRRFQEACELLERSVEIDARLGKARQRDLAFGHQLLGLCYLNLNRFSQAESSLLQAGELFARIGEAAQEAQAWNHLGVVYYYTGAYGQAEQTYRQALQRAAAAPELEPQILNNLGLLFYAWGRYQQALDAYQRARAQHLDSGQEYYAATNLGNIAGVYLAWGKYPEAVQTYQQVLRYFESTGEETGATSTVINLGLVYYTWGRYGEALELFERGLKQATDQGNPSARAWALSSMGDVFYATGRYDRALESYQESRELFQRFDMTLNAVATLGSIGVVYQAWGRSAEALEHYNRAVELAERIGARDQVLTNLRSIASVHLGNGRYELANRYYRRSLDLARELGRPSDEAIALDGLGMVCFQSRDFDDALQYYTQALEVARSIGKRDAISRALIHIGGVHQVREDSAAALQTYREALAMTRETGARADEATVLNNIGTLHLNRGEYQRAAEHFTKAIRVMEELRDTAEGEIRRDFLANWISSYRWLITTHLFREDAHAVFQASELIKARYLSEQIGAASGAGLGADSSTHGIAGIPAITEIQPKLSSSEAVISFVNIDWQYPLVVYADRGQLAVHGYDLEPFIRRNFRRHRTTIKRSANRTRGFTMVETEDAEGDQQLARFTEIIDTYRWLLARTDLSAAERRSREELGRELYSLLLEPLEDHLEDKDALTIIPDGVLAFLPLEALVLPDGRYLVERFHLRYLPSLTVSAQIEQRRYGAGRRTLLAFGGAVYQDGSAGQRADQSAGGQDTRQAYATLGIGSWQELPGTLAEVREIGRIVPGSTVVTGAQVCESRIKEMSEDGSLAGYRVLHFATHGLVVPPLPELSALVLSQGGGQQEDGYLTMGEIAELEIRADFVNLSACETGLGRIYGGEGVVGLSQAFLVAGANGLSVSLWQVSDESTRSFMTGLYELVERRGMDHQSAMTEMKRRFVADPSRNEPFYWAPFVYYGR